MYESYNLRNINRSQPYKYSIMPTSVQKSTIYQYISLNERQFAQKQNTSCSELPTWDRRIGNFHYDYIYSLFFLFTEGYFPKSLLLGNQRYHV